jgi:hypothetical protein
VPVALFSNGCDLSLFPGNCGARSLRFLFYVWANSQIAIRDLANVARAKHAETDREEMRKRSWFLPGIEPGIFGILSKFLTNRSFWANSSNVARRDAQLAFYLTTNDKLA